MADPGANAVAAAVPPSVAMVLTQARLPMAASSADLRHPVQTILGTRSFQLGDEEEIDVDPGDCLDDFSIGRTICPLMRGINSEM